MLAQFGSEASWKTVSAKLVRSDVVALRLMSNNKVAPVFLGLFANASQWPATCPARGVHLSLTECLPPPNQWHHTSRMDRRPNQWHVACWHVACCVCQAVSARALVAFRLVMDGHTFRLGF